MIKELKNKSGITLIALIITIIIMLILVVLTISMAINGGLFEKAGQAVGDTKNEINKEQELANGRIQIGGVWYDSIDDYLNNKPSEKQSGKWKKIVASGTSISALDFNGDIYIMDEEFFQLQKLVESNGKVIDIDLSNSTSSVYIMENGKAYNLEDSNNWICINDKYEKLKDKKIKTVDYQEHFILTEEGKVYNTVDNIWLNDQIDALKDRKILDLSIYLSDTQFVPMVILDDLKAYYINSQNNLTCLNDKYEELKDKKIISLGVCDASALVTDDGKTYLIVGDTIITINPPKDRKIIKANGCFILDTGELAIPGENDSWTIINESINELEEKRIIGMDKFGNLWLEDGKSYYSSQSEKIANLKDSPFLKFLDGKNIQQISSNVYNTVAIDSNGKVWAWGDNGEGQLGDGTNTDSDVPICISDITGNPLNGVKIEQVSVGSRSIVAIDENGKVWTWGYNWYGQLGNGETLTESNSIPICISDITGNPLNGVKIKQVSAGEDSIVAIDENGKVWTWGHNGSGELGDGTNTDSSIPICISNIEGNPLNSINIVQISTEAGPTVAVDNNGKVWSWGYNWRGQLGDGTNTESNIPICISNITGNPLNGVKIKQVSAAYYHMVALDENGKVWTWGYNGDGQLGNGTNTESNIPICISNINSSLKGKVINTINADNFLTILTDTLGNVYMYGTISTVS